MQLLNVYGFGVQLDSDIQAGNQGGRSYAVIAGSPQQAQADLAQQLGDELANIHGPNLIVAGALFSGSGGVTGPPVNTTVPYISGTGGVGGSLSCTMGEWTGTPTSYSYLWKSDGTVTVATGPTYVVQSTDSGHSLTCVVTATNAAGSADAPPSNAVAIP